MYTPHASELARLQRAAASTVQPGSLAEAEALAAIDDARDRELYELNDTAARARRRREKWWGRRDHMLGGI
jgi:hypothetical protein